MISAVVPAFNEEENIKKVIKNLKQVVNEVVVIDDGSSDDTVNIAKQSGAKVISHEINRGQGAAIETGRRYIEPTDTDYMVIFDGDGQFDVEDIPPALEEMKDKNADVLFGSRFLEVDSKLPISKKYFILPSARLIDSIFSGLKLSDVHNGFKIFNKQAIKEIEITQDRMAHSTEIPYQVKKKDLDYVEFPVSVTYKDYGQGMLGGFSILKDLVLSKFIR